jgi:AraC family transcriptional regulator
MAQDQGVTTAADTFADFVGHLAQALVEPVPSGAADAGAPGDLWAARSHFSRFHFDRMIRSVAGEPPQAFRRRILLERAAYRMVTTRAPLIDIAVEAGYGSHEAFTRAFSRAYGVGPAAWRRSPGRIRIPAPSGVHFHPPGSLRLPARDTVTAMDLLTRMLEHHVWLTGEMVRVAGRLGDDALDQPIEVEPDEDRQSIRSLLSRLIGQMGMWNAAVAMRDYDWSVEEHESLGSMRERLAVEGPDFLSQVREVVEQERLDDTFVDAICEDPEVFTYGGMIAHVLTFAAHRRTLVVLSMAKHGVDELGWGDPMVWVATPAS